MTALKLQHKKLIPALIELINAGIKYNLPDEAEVLLQYVRRQRPDVCELDSFEAWIEIKRGNFLDAIRVLRGFEDKVPKFYLGKALLAFCMFAIGDSAWKRIAHEVQENSTEPDALHLVALLRDPSTMPAAPETPPSNDPAGNDAPSLPLHETQNYLRG